MFLHCIILNCREIDSKLSIVSSKAFASKGTGICLLFALNSLFIAFQITILSALSVESFAISLG